MNYLLSTFSHTIQWRNAKLRALVTAHDYPGVLFSLKKNVGAPSPCRGVCGDVYYATEPQSSIVTYGRSVNGVGSNSGSGPVVIKLYHDIFELLNKPMYSN